MQSVPARSRPVGIDGSADAYPPTSVWRVGHSAPFGSVSFVSQ